MSLNINNFLCILNITPNIYIKIKINIMEPEIKQFYQEQNLLIDNILKIYYTNSDYKLIEEQIKNEIC